MSRVFQSLMLFVHLTYTILCYFAEVTLLCSFGSWSALVVNLRNVSRAFSLVNVIIDYEANI